MIMSILFILSKEVHLKGDKNVVFRDKMKEIYRNLLNDFVEILKERFRGHLISVVVFGSVARNMANEYSDIDVCIVLRDLPKSNYKRSKMIMVIELTHQEISNYLISMNKIKMQLAWL